MKNLKLILPAAVVASAMLGIGAASAADLPVKAPPPPPVPPCIWCGFYVGGSGGYGWAEPSDVIPFGTGRDLGLFSDGPAQIAAQLAGINSPVHVVPKGPLAGLQFGYNYQIQGVVLGFEADYSWANINGSGARSNTFPVTIFQPVGLVTTTTNVAVNEDLKSIGTVRGRLGVTPLPTLLLYGTGGFAFGQASSSTAINFVQKPPPGFNPDTFTPVAASASKTLTGWTVGLGAEWAFAPHWSLKGEFLYYDLGNLNYLVGTSTGFVHDNGPAFTTVTVAASTHFYGNIARVGVNYQFGGGPLVANY